MKPIDTKAILAIHVPRSDNYVLDAEYRNIDI